jgi:hypothetical protein
MRDSFVAGLIKTPPSTNEYTGKSCKCEKCGWEGTLDQNKEIIGVYDIRCMSGWAGHEFICPQPDCGGVIGRNMVMRL